MIITLINNRFVSKSNAKISLYSSAFSRGYGVFDTLRTYKNKQLFRPEQHVARLFQSAKSIGITPKYSEKETLEMIKKVTKKSPHKIQRIKPIIIEEGLIIQSMPAKINPKIYAGVSCTTTECIRSLPEVKSISYLASFLSHENATKKRFFEAILKDKRDEIYEGAYSNIFWFEGETLCTRDNEILKGITRQTILEISPYKIKFKTIKEKDLLKKYEIFLSQSVNIIVPITKINNKTIGNGKPGEKTKKLMELFQHTIKSHLT